MTRMFAGSLAAAVVAALAIGTTHLGAQAQSDQTFTGCLKPAKVGYLLTDATPSKAAAGAAKKNYNLIGLVPPGTTLRDHLNHKVEVSGSIGEPSQSTQEKLPTLTMTAVKMVSATCP